MLGGSHSRDGRRRLLLVSQDRLVTQILAGDVVGTRLDQEVDATVVDPTMPQFPTLIPSQNQTPKVLSASLLMSMKSSPNQRV